MKKIVLVEDEIRYQQNLIEACSKNGYQVVMTITPRWNMPAEKVADQIKAVNPDIILLDHDFCNCRLRHGRCQCLNGQDVFNKLGPLQDRVMSISGVNREYIRPIRNFSFKDCLVNADVTRNFGIKLRWMIDPTYIPPPLAMAR